MEVRDRETSFCCTSLHSKKIVTCESGVQGPVAPESDLFWDPGRILSAVEVALFFNIPESTRINNMLPNKGGGIDLTKLVMVYQEHYCIGLSNRHIRCS